MRIITWNCNMAFRKKAAFILELKPDILVVPECEHPDKLVFPKTTTKPKDQLWFGTNRNKGLGIFSYSKFRFRLIETHNPKFRMVVPIAVSGGKRDFTLYAVWANNIGDPDGPYITQVWKAINHYDKALCSSNTMLIGDFNSNTIWDKPRRIGNHSTVVAQLEQKGIHSVYHRHFKQQQGKELHPTLYMYRHKDKPYHIDYCFTSIDLLDQVRSVEIGDYENWTKYSDHVPVIVNLKT